ncbi:hypothetical protein ACO0K9_06880 [Undibacterium sp. Ji50W]
MTRSQICRADVADIKGPEGISRLAAIKKLQLQIKARMMLSLSCG